MNLCSVTSASSGYCCHQLIRWLMGSFFCVLTDVQKEAVLSGDYSPRCCIIFFLLWERHTLKHGKDEFGERIRNGIRRTGGGLQRSLQMPVGRLKQQNKTIKTALIIHALKNNLRCWSTAGSRFVSENCSGGWSILRVFFFSDISADDQNVKIQRKAAKLQV